MRRLTLRRAHLRRLVCGAAVAASALAACSTGTPAAPSDPALQAGWRVYRDRSCGSCHEIGGNGGRIGPPLTHIGALAESRKPGTTATDYLRESITDPSAFIVPGYPDSMPHGLERDMPARDIDDLVRYLASLR
jgi:mono/diheme cytochrome c family protein